MKSAGRGGFVFILTVVAISLIGTAVFLLSVGSRDMLFGADRAYVEAGVRNLTASGRAWAQRRTPEERPAAETEEVELATDELNVPGASLRVAVTDSTGQAAGVKISVRYRRNTIAVQRDRTYTITGKTR